MSASLDIPRASTVVASSISSSDAPASPDPASSSFPVSTTSTYVDLQAAKDKELEKDEGDATRAATPEPKTATVEATSDKPRLSQTKKWSLLAMFSLAFFIDIWCYSAFFIFTDTISTDLGIVFEQQSWVITSYSVTFAAFLLFWGRVSDLYSAQPVFNWGFLGLGVLSLIISFLPDKYSFFVLRALAGISGACLIPASYRLIAYVFEEHELSKAFTLYGMSGAIANVTGTLVAGFIEYIPGGGQMQSWRWFFRILAILIIPVATLAFLVVPKPSANGSKGSSRWKRLDIVGSVLMLAAIVLLVLGLTLGASYGWRKPGFLVPFLLSFVLFPAFFVWEHRASRGEPGSELALLPSRTWRIPNFMTFIAFTLVIYPWWGTNFLVFIEEFTMVRGEKPIIAAVRVLPQGIAALIMTLVLTAFPRLVSRPRWPIAGGLILGIVGYILMTRPHNYVGSEYWRYLFPAYVLGSGGLMVAFTATNVGVMTSVPAEMSGVAGAVLQVGYQVGASVGFGVQAGLLTVNPGGITNRDNINASLYFMLGWTALWLIGFLVLYRQPKNDLADAEKAPVALVH